VSLYDELIAPIGAEPIRRVVIGVHWTLVESDHGCGLAQTPRRNAIGAKPVPDSGRLETFSLRAIAERVHSDNPLEAVIGMAGINAFHNRYDREGPPDNGLGTFRDVDGPVTVIGRFPSLEKYLRDFRVVELEPREGEYPESAFGELAADSAGVVITASTLVNKSAERLFEQAQGRRIAIVGPGTPLAPRLHKLGVEILAGSVVRDATMAAAVISQSGAAPQLKPLCRYVSLRAPLPQPDLRAG
jgi:uncharacterized protein (DUF4213/DUF364 family)